MTDIPHLPEITSIISNNLPEAEAWCFGSRMNGKAKTYSDLDILLKLPENEISLKKMGILRDDLEASDIPFKIDIIDWYHIKPDFRDTILKEAQKIL